MTVSVSNPEDEECHPLVIDGEYNEVPKMCQRKESFHRSNKQSIKIKMHSHWITKNVEPNEKIEQWHETSY